MNALTTDLYVAPERREFTTLGKLYAWSIVFEPLLFFLLASNTATGVTPNPGRILQFLVWLCLLVRWLRPLERLRVPNPASGLYANYSLYMAVCIVAGAIGIGMGSYTLHDQYSTANASSMIAAILRSPAIRPFFEYFIAIYYFVYFVILPRYLLNSEAGVRYFFRVFRAVFLVGLALGTVDFLLAIVGIEFIPRHLSDGVHVGTRFHGLAGEPRDAFVYLMFCLAVLSLHRYWARGRSLGQLWTITIVAAALLTQSASGLFGLVFAGLLILFFSLRSLSPRTLMLAGILAVALGIAVFLGVWFSPRIQVYLQALTLIFDRIDRGGAVPSIMLGQMSNIYPVWDMLQKLKEGNLIQLLLGSGLGSSSVVTNNLGAFKELANPHTQIVRVLYESGVVGLYFLVMSFVAPVRSLTARLPPIVRRRFLFLTLLLLGVFLSHRSAVPYIYLGIFIVVMQRILAQPAFVPAAAPMLAEPLPGRSA